MRYLLAFLWKHNFFFLFVALELLAFMLMTNSRNYQGAVIINATSELTGGLNSASSNIGNYFSLKRANQQLLQENTELLQNQLDSAHVIFNVQPVSYVRPIAINRHWLAVQRINNH